MKKTTAGTDNAFPTPHGDGNFIQQTSKKSKMQPHPHPGTEPQTRYRREDSRLYLLYDWNMSWNALRN